MEEEKKEPTTETAGHATGLGSIISGFIKDLPLSHDSLTWEEDADTIFSAFRVVSLSNESKARLKSSANDYRFDPAYRVIQLMRDVRISSLSLSADLRGDEKEIALKRQELAKEFVARLYDECNISARLANITPELWEKSLAFLSKAFDSALRNPDEALEAAQAFIDSLPQLEIKSVASVAQEETAAAQLKSIVSISDYDDSKSFWLLVQNADGNMLQKMLTKRITDPKQLDLYGHGHIISKDFKLHIHLYNELQTGVHQTAARLLDCLMIIATREGLRDTLVTLPLKEYMSMRGLSDEKETRAQVLRDIDALERTSFEYKGTGKNRGAWLRVSVAGGTVGQIKNGDIIFRFNQDFYDSFKASDTGKYMYMYFPREALRANINRNPYTYWLARKIAEHKRMNIDRPNADIIGVKTLIDACPNFPTYDDVNSTTRDITRRIIEPFERDMDEITDTYSWHYTNGQPSDYQEFINSTVTITWKDYPDTTKLKIGRAKQAKKLKTAEGEKKKKASAPEGK